MATIQTIDGEVHTVKETYEEVYQALISELCIKVGIIELTYCYNNSESKPVSFFKNAIIAYSK
jgi:hypothetical protein